MIYNLRKLKLNEVITEQTQSLMQSRYLENFEHGNQSRKFLTNRLKLKKQKKIFLL